MTESLAWPPVLLALTAAFLFGNAVTIAKRGLQWVNPQLGSMITIATCMVLYLLPAPWWMRAEDWFSPGFWVFVLNGLLHPLFSMYLSMEATSRIGPTVSATFAATSPLFAALTAVLALGETLDLLIAGGTLAVVVGVISLTWKPQGVRTVVYAALLFATGAAVIRGLNQSLGKFGLELMPNVFMAGFVSFAVSTAGAVLLYRWRQGHFPRAIDPRGLRNFIFNGCLIGTAIGCMFFALHLGRVVVVAPIVAAYPLFTLFTATVAGQERLGSRALAGVALVVGGVVVISLGTAL